MASGYLFIDGRDPDAIFQSGNAGIVTDLAHESSGVDLGSLYASGNSGITTGLKSKSGVDIGSLFALPSGSLPISGQTFLGTNSVAGGFSTSIINFNVNSSTWAVVGSTSDTSGSVPSGATSVKVTYTYVSGSTAGSVTNPMSSTTTLTSTTLDSYVHLSAAVSSPASANYSVNVEFMNSAGSVISNTTFTYFPQTSG
ncbi:hypothetical protein [Dyella mobilis]|uniref:Uncharacterized protein n=1 Tax=Dyella mobilis TaxID=1849582 RepID=A0ABS2KKJ6_9GAMM|nr:hypothetical protein [Dyella mobilis]MBM7131540.1 hypothetical protein [Dyella mobilis]GLQ96489.1 hypothetical protein GCM10007863_09070 [Dyella mobilis]